MGDRQSDIGKVMATSKMARRHKAIEGGEEEGRQTLDEHDDDEIGKMCR